MTIPRIELNDGTSIPQLGFGVFRVPSPETEKVVAEALAAGYRHLDTAQMYGNEEGVGQAIAASGLPRDELYVTTKLDNGFHRPDDARRAFDDSLTRLGLDRVDLFLIHWPLPMLYDGDFVSTWQTLVELREDGRATSVGVSNFQPDHLDRIVEETGVTPVVNQVECHPFFRNDPVRTANGRHGVVTEAWAPIAKGRVGDDETIGEIASLTGRTAAQVVLRWHLQHGHVVFPKTTRPERMRENADLFDFELTDEQMVAIDALNRGEDGRAGAHPDRFDRV
ncbi:MAG: aldo/keto reductase [Nocardioides sp.]